jgi:hypothetical protein
MDHNAPVRAEDVEAHIFSDVSMTLHLFNSIIPSAIRGAVTFVRQVRRRLRRSLRATT